MSSKFNARNAGSYEQMMGRWSRKLARPFLEFAGIADGERILDVGCGTGSLTRVLREMADLAEVRGIDYSQAYVEAARAAIADPRVSFEQGDVTALPFEDRAFDRTLALLVLHFVPESEQAVAQMCRVTRPGGVVAAAVWDGFGGMPTHRMIWDTAVTLDPEAAAVRAENYWKPLTRPGEMKALWEKRGLESVCDTNLLIRMEFAGFADYWQPVAEGEGAMGAYVTGLSDAKRARFEQAARAAFEAGEPDGPRSFAAVAWACRGTVPA